MKPHVTSTLRPLRLAIGGRVRTEIDLLKLFTLNTMMWGGRQNPILPIFDDIPGSERLCMIEEGADPLLVAKRNGHSSTRMVLDRYGHLFEGARRQAALTMDRVFAKATMGRQMVVKPADAGEQKKTPIPKRLWNRR